MGSRWKSVEVIGSQQQRVIFSRRELLGVIESHWKSLGAVRVNFPTNHLPHGMHRRREKREVGRVRAGHRDQRLGVGSRGSQENG